MSRARWAAAALAWAACLVGSCAAPPAEGPKAAAPVAAAPGQLPLGRPLPGQGSSGGVVLRNPGFEVPFPAGGRCPPGWDCAAHSGAQSFRFFYDESHPAKGRASACIEPVTREPWAKLVQAHGHIESLRGKRVRLSALVRLENVAGAGAGPILIAQGGSGNEVASRVELKPGNGDWHPVQVELEVPQSAFLLELGLVLEGTGRACVDEVRLEVL